MSSAIRPLIGEIELHQHAAKNGIVDLTAFAHRDKRLPLGIDHFAFGAP